MGRGTKAGEDSVDRRPLVAPVVHDRKGQVESVGLLAHCQHLRARLPERPQSALGERLTAEPRERLRRAEPLGRAADEQHARRG